MSSEDLPQRLGNQTRRGLSWNLIGAIATNGTRIVVVAVLGRALTSRDFGIVAAAISVNTIVYSIRDIGVGPALIQRKNLDETHIKTAFAVATYMGVLLAGLLCLAAPLIGRVFGIERSVDVIRALALLFVLRNVAATSRMLCRRDMNFRLVAIIDTSSFVVGSVVSIIAVIIIGGPWSLVLGYWVEEIIATALYLARRPPPVSFRVDGARLRELMTFGAGQTITSIMNVIATYGDNVVVETRLGPEALGFYSRAFDLIRFPALVFEAIVGNVLFAAFSRIQDDREHLALNFRRVLFVNGLLLLPASAFLVVAAPEVIRLLVGPGWGDAVLPFRILAVTIMLRTDQKLGALVAQATGAVNAVALSFTVYMAIVVGGAAFSIQWGVPGVAVTTAIAMTVLCVECCYLALRVSFLPAKELVRANLPGFVLAAAVTAVAWPTAEITRRHEASFVVTLALSAVVAGLAFVGFVAIWLRRARGDFAWLAREVATLREQRRGVTRPRVA